ncbi:hypothetical protein THAOC_03407 [Thalassiosira oceanica]|uniref:Thioredoxin domain-containing protein n=1 Tax=Thalassiosira oceanica TaxID=159749 RepID=K0TBK9_THAOC|nr:hypothetical protein THAOC_03407 [Thalassiosira oceanica]|eukprot:EJK74890.1 hypothetical protein THAOC_03407 [Thalassiosira oceanica]
MITRAAIGAIVTSLVTDKAAVIGFTATACRRAIIPAGRPRIQHLHLHEADQAITDGDDVRPDLDGMRLREIREELKELNISFVDCFDRESLVARLREARDGLVEPLKTLKVESAATTVDGLETTGDGDTEAADATSTKESIDEEEFDREATLSELRDLRIKELKIRLTDLGIRWGTFIEKEDMVQAVLGALEHKFELARNFSRSGDIMPSTVTDVDEATLLKELGWREEDVNRGVITAAAEPSSQVHPPILLDAYATWCGPCQMVAPFLKAASEELGSVAGLPTLIRFDGGEISKEMQRVEGALSKDQILQFAKGDFRM